MEHFSPVFQCHPLNVEKKRRGIGQAVGHRAFDEFTLKAGNETIFLRGTRPRARDLRVDCFITYNN
jgi:hypothetical protein